VTAALAMYTFSTMGAMAVVLWTPSPALRERTQGPVWQLKWWGSPDEVVSHTIDNELYHTCLQLRDPEDFRATILRTTAFLRARKICENRLTLSHALSTQLLLEEDPQEPKHCSNRRISTTQLMYTTALQGVTGAQRSDVRRTSVAATFVNHA